MNYINFKKILFESLNNGMNNDFNEDILLSILENPKRYVSLFRFSNIQTKIIQHFTQKLEIKFGFFLENLLSEYIKEMNYSLIDKSPFIEKGIHIDQIFSDKDFIYIIEQKVRDDHDSTKRVGQIDNFYIKINEVQNLYPDKKVKAIMWFTDDLFFKNKNFYEKTLIDKPIKNCQTFIFYGKDIFENIFKRVDIWEEILDYLNRYKLEIKNNKNNIIDFDKSKRGLFLLLKINNSKPYLIKKLIFSDGLYSLIRDELFPTSTNLNILKEQIYK